MFVADEIVEETRHRKGEEEDQRETDHHAAEDADADATAGGELCRRGLGRKPLPPLQ